jgi:hypothetical protein
VKAGSAEVSERCDVVLDNLEMFPTPIAHLGNGARHDVSSHSIADVADDADRRIE